MRVAAVNWKLEPGSTTTFCDHMDRLVSKAVRASADVVVLPECIDLECLGDVPDLPIPEVAAFLANSFSTRAEYMRELSQSHRILIVGGSMMVQDGDEYRNRCLICDRGEVTFQDKIVMTQFELTEWGLSAGAGIATLPDPRLGVTICYDCEFPISSRIIAERGGLCQVVPAFTETRYGFQRVRWSCHARAIEHQIYVVHASLVGTLSQEPVPKTYGSSAVITPSCEGFPETAVLAESEYDAESMAVADLDFDLLLKSRETGDVRNWHDRDRGRWTLNS